jgi:hypothetical protein
VALIGPGELPVMRSSSEGIGNGLMCSKHVMLRHSRRKLKSMNNKRLIASLSLSLSHFADEGEGQGR